MSNNPFETGNDAPADPWSAPTPNAPEAPVTAAPVSADVKHPFSIKLTLKAADGFDAEWINPWVSGATADEAALNTVAILNALAKHGVIDKTANAAQYTREQYKGERRPRGGGNGGGGQRGNSQTTTAPPPGVAQQSCKHGPMEFKTGTSKKGNAYKVWSCTDPDDQCKGIFVK
ncbi:hypothetical protein AB0C87_25210 [Actinomadura sp. NPDC048021]|uniref:hypothetical protein n=1 Tax=Actinomadura sp. NPDC048021 TaxID=3155385 RepID=UPI0033E534F6